MSEFKEALTNATKGWKGSAMIAAGAAIMTFSTGFSDKDQIQSIFNNNMNYAGLACGGMLAFAGLAGKALNETSKKVKSDELTKGDMKSAGGAGIANLSKDCNDFMKIAKEQAVTNREAEKTNKKEIPFTIGIGNSNTPFYANMAARKKGHAY